MSCWGERGAGQRGGGSPLLIPPSLPSTRRSLDPAAPGPALEPARRMRHPLYRGEAEARGAGGLPPARHAGPDQASQRSQARGPATEQTPGAWRVLRSPSPLLASFLCSQTRVAGEGVGVLVRAWGAGEGVGCWRGRGVPARAWGAGAGVGCWRVLAPRLSPSMVTRALPGHDLAGCPEGGHPPQVPASACAITPHAAAPTSCVPGHVPGVACPGGARALSARPWRQPSEAHAVAIPFTGGETEAQKAQVTRPGSQSRRWGSQARGPRRPGPRCWV